MRQQWLYSFIPAPGDWGQKYRLYGIMIALGVIAGLELARRRWQARGGNPEDMSAIALWAVPAGLIGARLYHVITDNELYRAPLGQWYQAFFIWKGGLGIPGGIIGGVLVGVLVAHHRGIRLPTGLDVVAPALPLAQAIGRWGNYFNQELFGRPTDMPWGLEVTPFKRPAGYEQFATFHPTFLYEMLWNLALVGFLIWLDRKRVIRPGRLFPLYLGGYFLGRLWVEALRSDEANKILGLRVNIWTSILVIVGVIVTLAIIGLRRRPGDSDEPYRDGHRWDPETGIIEPASSTGSDGIADGPATGTTGGLPMETKTEMPAEPGSERATVTGGVGQAWSRARRGGNADAPDDELRDAGGDDAKPSVSEPPAAT